VGEHGSNKEDKGRRPVMAEISRSEFIGRMHEYANSLEEDMARVAGLLDQEVITEAEHDEIQGRLRAEHETVTDMIAQFRKYL
jgi:hypothetical protein